MATENKSDAMTFNLEPLLTPISIVISGILISASFFFGLGNADFSTTGRKSTSDTPIAVPDGTDPLVALAGEIGVDPDEFSACLSENDFTDEIAADVAAGTEAGVQGTPGFVIGVLDADGNVDGVAIAGAQPIDAFKTVIDEQLKRADDPSIKSSTAAAKTSLDDDPIIGDRDNAKIAIVEFSDYECPFCQRHHQTTHSQLVSDYVDTGLAVLSYRDFPLSFHEPKASEEASAANCIQILAGDEKYFEYSTLIYERTQTNGTGLV